jgi:hypothetical protein
MGDGDGLMGGLGTLIVAGAVLGAMNNRNRERTRTVTRTRYVTRTKPKYLKTKKLTKKRRVKASTSFFD